MKSHQILSLMALLSLTLATEELSCGTIGISTIAPSFASTSPELRHAVACGERCALDTKCQSYAIGVGQCLHYALPVSSIVNVSHSSPWTLYDKDCAPVIVQNASLAAVNQFISPGAPCLIEPNSTKSRFRLLGPDFVPLVKTADKQLQPVLDAALKDEGQAQENGSVAHFDKAPNFFFEKPANAPEGLYDLVMTGPEPHYVGKAVDGRLVLISASTGPTAQHVDGKMTVTSIFTVDCDGRIGVMHDGISYGWNIDDDGMSTSFTAGAHSSHNTMVAFDYDAFGIEEGPRHELRSLVKRDDTRCGPGKHAVTKPNARAPSANGCGSKSSHKIIPELYFHECCNNHDYCYDNCDEQTCDHCNDAFYTCMKARCSHFSIFKKAFCYTAASLYYEAVKGRFGCPYFHKYTAERCDCVCC